MAITAILGETMRVMEMVAVNARPDTPKMVLSEQHVRREPTRMNSTRMITSAVTLGGKPSDAMR